MAEPTDFKKDEVLLSAFSPGGLSLVSVPDLIPGETASTLVDQSGVGVFNRVQLRNRLSGKVVSLSPFVGELRGLSGGCSPEDLQTLFELIHLTFTSPRLEHREPFRPSSATCARAWPTAGPSPSPG